MVFLRRLRKMLAFLFVCLCMGYRRVEDGHVVFVVDATLHTTTLLVPLGLPYFPVYSSTCTMSHCFRCSSLFVLKLDAG